MQIDLKAFQLALQHHQAGQLPQAENLYRQILSSAPEGMPEHCTISAFSPAKPDGMTSQQILIPLANPSPSALCRAKPIQQSRQPCEPPAVYRRQAAAAARQPISLNPNDAQAYNNLGTVLDDIGQPIQAIAAYRQAISLNPNFAPAHSNLGASLQKTQDQLEESGYRFPRATQFSSTQTTRKPTTTSPTP